MSKDVTARYRWSLPEITESNRWHRRQSTVNQMVERGLLALVGVCLVAAVYFYFDGWRQPAFPARHAASRSWFWEGGLVYLVVIFLLRRLVVSWQLRRSYARSPAKDSEVVWHISEEALRVEYVHGSSQQAWSAFYKAVLTPRGLLLYPQPRLYQWLPRHAFQAEGDFDLVAEMARRQISAFRRLK